MTELTEVLITSLFPVEGNPVTCGNRTDLPKNQRRHSWVPLGTDVKNCGEKGICETEVSACHRCGRDKRLWRSISPRPGYANAAGK